MIRNPNLIIVALLFAFSNICYSQTWEQEFQKALEIARKQMFYESLDVFYNAKRLAKEAGETDNETYFEYLVIMTGPLSSIGLASEQGEIIQESLELSERVFGKTSKQYAQALDMKGNWFVQYTQEYDKAVEVFLQSYKIKLKVYIDGKYNNDLDWSLKYLGWYNALLSNTNPELADLSYIEKRLDIVEELLGQNNKNYAAALSVTASSYELINNYQKALSFHMKALRILNELGTDKSVLEFRAQTLIDIGTMQHKYYKWSSDRSVLLAAINSLLQGVKEMELIGTWRINLPRHYKDIGLLYMELKEYEKAKDAFKKSIEIQRDFYADGSFMNSYILIEVGQAYMDHGLLDEASGYIIETCTILIETIRNNYKYLSEEEKEKFYFTNVTPAFECLNTLVMLHNEARPELKALLYNFRLATKGILLNNQSDIIQYIANTNDKYLADLFTQWSAKKNLFSLKHSNPSNISLDINEIKKDIDLIEREMSKKAYSSLNGGSHVRSWEEILGILSENEAAIEIIRFRYYHKGFTDSVCYAALILTKGCNEPRLVYLKNGNELENSVFSSYRRDIQNHNVVHINSTVYEKLWRPIDQNLKSLKTVYISKDGIYNMLNINTLFNEEAGCYLFELKDIITLSRTDELFEKKVNVYPENAFLFGRPTFYDNITLDTISKENTMWYSDLPRHYSIQNTKLSDLPGTEKEVNEISFLLNEKGIKTVVYLKKDASEANLKKILKPSVLHIATHGFFFGDLNMSGIKTEKGTVSFRGLQERGTTLKNNVMHNSGLILAKFQNQAIHQNNNTFDDGVLTAYEASALNLSNTQLVVLSACETGLGSVKNGEGIYGLQRAFKIAGAKAILMSMWSVDDEATSDFMLSFYAEWMNSRDMVKAYKIAMSNTKKKYNHPYYWGAFELLGS